MDPHLFPSLTRIQEGKVGKYHRKTCKEIGKNCICIQIFKVIYTISLVLIFLLFDLTNALFFNFNRKYQLGPAFLSFLLRHIVSIHFPLVDSCHLDNSNLTSLTNESVNCKLYVKL